ncbi:MAG: WYL domain-containing protein [Deltaproteobacteria bacterium]|nr:WYL domain-containing protein [Deltaproteobacteria bacterium]
MSAARTERLLNLLTLLLNTRRPISLRELREHEEFSAYRTKDPKSGERAFERDKAALVELGVPLIWVSPEQLEDDEDGVGGYLVDRERYFLPELNLDKGELALLSIAGAAAAAIEGFPGRAAVIRALAKLGFDVDLTRGPPTLAHAPIHEGKDPGRIAVHLQLLHEAVARRQTVTLAYRGASGETSKRDVDPYGLYYRQGIWYLVGRCHMRRGERTFHLGRIQDVRLQAPDRHTPAFEVPPTFDLKAHVLMRPWEYPNEAPTAVVIRLAERLVPAIPEIFGRRAVLERTPRGPVVRLQVTHQTALVAAVLPYGAAAEVLEPAPLRALIRGIYEQLARRYAGRRRPAPRSAQSGASP